MEGVGTHTLIVSVRTLKILRWCVPLRYAMTSGIPLDAAEGWTSTTIADAAHAKATAMSIHTG